ncbi:hypothetical protein NDU88_007006 [Pleurodeles waltl]|uniref:Uncharacterized protein n=1 Tax=Pleurodeles waltl TaxID=8319 RepID=A0AAV7MHF3_PLEWA|nr:hypothetical protein NDU88_007006 [Pleurodeles waltl]
MNVASVPPPGQFFRPDLSAVRSFCGCLGEKPEGRIVVLTKDGDLVTNLQTLNVSELRHVIKEKLIPEYYYMPNLLSASGQTSIPTRAVDSDLAAIALYAFSSLNLSN